MLISDIQGIITQANQQTECLLVISAYETARQSIDNHLGAGPLSLNAS